MCGHPAGGQRLHLRPGDRHPELAEPFHHAPAAAAPALDDRGALRGQHRVRRVGAVGEQVHAVTRQPAGQLHAGDERQPRRQRPGRLGLAGQGVVVGERDHVQPGLPGPAHHLGGRIGAVGGGTVDVEVDAHERQW
jgi:hypothetical protein